MKICIKDEKSDIENTDIKWYLSDGTLWLSKEYSYFYVEDIIETSYGSFNWLYDINDTFMFKKENGKFIMAVIRIKDEIDVLKESLKSESNICRGDIFLCDKQNINFEFQGKFKYLYEVDTLISLENKYSMKPNLKELYITDDFSFYIIEDTLIGWKLINSSKHIYPSNITTEGKEIDRNSKNLLLSYLEVLKVWEENEESDPVEKLLDTVKEDDTITKSVIKEALVNILEW